MKWTHLAISAVFGLAAVAAMPQGKGGKAGPPSHNNGPSKGSPPPQTGGGGSPSKGNPPSAPPQTGSGGSPSKGSPPSAPPQSGGGGIGKGSPPSKGGGSGHTNPPPQYGGGGISKGSPPPPWGGGVYDKNLPPRKQPPPPGGYVGGRPDPDYQKEGIRNRGDVFDRYKKRDQDSRDGDVFRRDPRNGNIAIGGKSNNKGSGGGRADKIERIPINPKSGVIDVRVPRKPDRYTVQPKWREGYDHYDRGWNDSYWRYNYYRFNPYEGDCVVSPWYYYRHLPAYLIISRIIYIDYQPWYFRGDPYRWQRIGYGNASYTQLDYAVEDIVQAFEQGDRRSLARVIPRAGRINIAVDGQYAYSVGSDDFYDMMLDLTQSTRTTQYRILDVRRYRNEAQVSAEHVYTDPYGQRETMFHTYRLEQDRGGYVIRDFGSSAYRYGGY